MGRNRAYRDAVSRASRFAWLVLGAIASALLVWVLRDVLRSSPAPTIVPLAHRLPPVRRSADPFARWTVTEQFAAQGVIVLQVETRHLNDAPAIAAQLAGPLQARYTEVLIYFHRPGRPDALAPRRVQWTPAAGYVDTVYGR